MILRGIINLVRWTWGYSSLPLPETIDQRILFLMILGAWIDFFVVIIVVKLVRMWRKDWKESKGGAR